MTIGSFTGDYTAGQAAVGADLLADLNTIKTAYNTHETAATLNHPDSSVTAAKLAGDSVITTKIADLNVTTAKIAADAVDGTKIADDSIDSEHYVDGSIDSAHLADDCVTIAKSAAGVSGYHGNQTTIKLIPSDFISTNKNYSLNTPASSSAKGGDFAAGGADAVDVCATVNIPAGYKATVVRVYGSDLSNVVTVYECLISDASETEKGTGTCAAEIDITDVDATATNYLSIYCNMGANDVLYGGYVTIEAI